jgi:hypothetical protein
MDCLKSVSCPLCRTVSRDPAGRIERRLYGRLEYSWFTRGSIRLAFSRPHAPDPACQFPPNVHGRGAILLKLENEGNDPWTDESVIVNHDVSVFCPGMAFSRSGPLPLGSMGRLRVYIRGRHGGAGSLRLTWNRKNLRIWQDGNRRSRLPLEVDAEPISGLRHTACLEFGLREWAGDMTLFVEGIEESTRAGDGLLRLEYIDQYGESIPYGGSPDEIRLTVIPGSPSG